MWRQAAALQPWFTILGETGQSLDFGFVTLDFNRKFKIRNPKFLNNPSGTGCIAAPALR
jgi:hypothetical protein